MRVSPDAPPGWDQWEVCCQKVIGGKRKSNIVQWVYVKAKSREIAEKVGTTVTGLRYASAFPYYPWKDSAFAGRVIAADAPNPLIRI